MDGALVYSFDDSTDSDSAPSLPDMPEAVSLKSVSSQDFSAAPSAEVECLDSSPAGMAASEPARIAPIHPKRSLRIAMVAYTFYEADNRVMRYAEALADRGDKVDIFALSSSASPKKRETLNGVNVYRLQTRTEHLKL